MLINRENLKKITEGLSKVFAGALEAAETLYEKVSTVVKASALTMNYAWLADTPKMKKWVGDRVLKNLKAFTYAITKEKWEATIEVDADDIKYDNLGIVKPRIEQMAADAKSGYDELIFDMLEKNGLCYDGKEFFHKEHEVGEAGSAEKFSNLGTKKLTRKSFLDARAEMRGLTSENGRPLRIRPNLLVIPPELEQVAIEILMQDTLASGESNTTKGMAEYIVVDYLTDPDAWYLMDTTKPLKPLILQVNEDIKFTAMDKEDDENVFMRDTFRYGVSAHHNAGYGLWQLAYKSTGTEV